MATGYDLHDGLRFREATTGVELFFNFDTGTIYRVVPGGLQVDHLATSEELLRIIRVMRLHKPTIPIDLSDHRRV